MTEKTVSQAFPMVGALDNAGQVSQNKGAGVGIIIEKT